MKLMTVMDLRQVRFLKLVPHHLPIQKIWRVGVPMNLVCQNADTPDGPEGSDLECSVPELGDGRLRLEHECRGHWPYDRGCDDCVQSRGRTPARRVGQA